MALGWLRPDHDVPGREQWQKQSSSARKGQNWGGDASQREWLQSLLTRKRVLIGRLAKVSRQKQVPTSSHTLKAKQKIKHKNPIPEDEEFHHQMQTLGG